MLKLVMFPFVIRRRFYLQLIAKRNLPRPSAGLLSPLQNFWVVGQSIASLLAVTFFLISSTAQAQSKQTSVRIAVANREVHITIESAKARDRWSFLESYGSAVDLRQRLGKLHSYSADGEVSGTSLRSGVYSLPHPVSKITYDVQLSRTLAKDAAQVSWLSSQCGLLLLDDLLPQEILDEGQALDVSLETPRDWSVASTIGEIRSGNYSVKEPRNAIFVISPTINSKSKSVEGTNLSLVSAGTWPFKESRALNRAAEILKYHSRLTGFRLRKPPTVFLLPMPSNAPSEKWVAETRGSVVVLVLDQRAGFKKWIGQLEVILAHELLHLWVPNSLTLTGAYDWFFEGFTMYLALRAAVDLKVIGFNEYLITLARVYDSYLEKSEHMSLIEASKQRWTNTSTVYDKGMLLAFLYDLHLSEETGGKRKLADSYAELFSRYATRIGDANEAIMSILVTSKATDELLRSYLEGRQSLNLSREIEKYGLLLQTESGQSVLKVASNLTKVQLRLLESLGYRS